MQPVQSIADRYARKLKTRVRQPSEEKHEEPSLGEQAGIIQVCGEGEHNTPFLGVCGEGEHVTPFLGVCGEGEHFTPFLGGASGYCVRGTTPFGEQVGM